jgi:hypothetical protein
MIVFSTVMLWYSGFLSYNKELVKLGREGTSPDVSLSMGFVSMLTNIDDIQDSLHKSNLIQHQDIASRNVNDR